MLRTPAPLIGALAVKFKEDIEMQVFISWSGARSKEVAVAIADWLSQVIQAVDPWISSDIDKGARWSPEIAGRLEQSKVGIVCLTKENVDNRWILFEAGAMSKTKDAYVCTLLLDLLPTDVEQPLGQFQHTTRSKEEIHQLVKTINKVVEKCGERALPDLRLDEVFETYWPKLSDTLERTAKKSHIEATPTPRSERELLEEILELSRQNQRRIANLTRSKTIEALYTAPQPHERKNFLASNVNWVFSDSDDLATKLTKADRDALIRALKERADKNTNNPDSDSNDPDPVDG